MKRVIMVLVAVLAAGSVQAATIGAAASGELRFGPSDTDDGNGVGYASVSGIYDNFIYRHTYSAEASFSQDAYAPALNAYVYHEYGNTNESMRGTAYAYQAYRNTSDVSQEYTINLRLQGLGSDNYVDVNFSIFSGMEVIEEGQPGFLACSECTDLYGFNAKTTGSILEQGFNPSGSELILDSLYTTITDTVTFSVDAGEEFLLYTSLQADSYIGTSGASLTMAFADTSNLAALGADPSPVPVPAAVWLFGSGLLGLIGYSRRTSA